MLGSAPLEAVLGAGVDNRDHEAVRAFIRQAADLGLNILFIYPDSKIPADMRTPRQRTADNKAAQAAAKEAGRRDWATVKAPAGLSLATDHKPTLEKYLKQYIAVYSTWETVGEAGPTGEKANWSKKAEDAGEITMTEPAAINLAVEVGGSGVVVVDCDTAAQMARWFEANELDDPTEWPAPTVVTPGHMGEDADPDDPSTWSHSDGGHFWFTVPDKYLPVLPRHIGAMTWGGDNGFAVLWDRRYVLIPPSTRPEGKYEQLGHVYDLPPWLADEIIKAGERRVQRAALAGGARTENTDLADVVDTWAQNVSWASILEPLGWTPHPRTDACGCAVWTAPGDHASPKSATAHDTGCTSGRYSEVNAPLYIWTDHDVEPFENWLADHETRTLSKLQAVAVINFGGNIGKAMDELDLTPDLSVEPGIDVKGIDADLDVSGDGDFELPGPGDPGAAYVDHDLPPLPRQYENVDVVIDQGRDDSDNSGLFCHQCQTDAGEFMVVEADHQTTEVWHRIDEDDNEGHRAEAPTVDIRPDGSYSITAPANQVTDIIDPPPTTYADDLSDLPADIGKTKSPYPDEVDDPNPDVFDSPHNGVPRIAPFSHWRDMPPPEYIIDGLLEHGGLTAIIGSPNVGKSTVVLDMLCHIATGKRWQGRTTRKTRVLYLPGEGLAGAVQRIKAWEDAHDVDLDDNLLLGNGIILVGAQNEAWGAIAEYITRQGVGLVVFDTFARMANGLEENSATDVGKAVRRFDKLRELTNAGVCVVHHTAKGAPDVARGSSALNGALDSELLVRNATWDTDQIRDNDGRAPGKPIEVLTSKQKNIEQLEHPIPLLMISKVVRNRDIESSAPLITGPNGTVDPMQGEIIMARPPAEPVVETAIRIREFLDNLPKQGATRTELVAAIRPDAYARQRADAAAYWKQRIGEAVDRALRYELIETLSGTPSGARYIPNAAVTPDEARAAAAEEIINDQDD